MAFNLDSNIFMQGAAMENQQQQSFFDNLARSVAMYQQNQALQQKKQELANDPDVLAEQGMMKLAQGIPTSPQEYAAVQVWQAKQRPIFDPVTGQMKGAPDVFQSLGEQQAAQQTAIQQSGMPMSAPPTAPQAPRGVFDVSQLAAPDMSGMNPKEQQLIKEEKIKSAFDVQKEERERKNPMKYNANQLEAAGFAARMKESNDIINTLPPDANQGKTGLAGIAEQVLSAIPSAGMTDKIGQGVVKVAASPEEQQYLNAAQNWIRANLRKESGAVIGPQEMIDEYATYFPVAGDKPEVIKQKKKLRETTTKNMINQSAGAYNLQNPKPTTPQKPPLTREQALQILRYKGRIK